MVSAGILVYDTFTTFMNVINKSEEIKENGRKKHELSYNDMTFQF